VIVSVVVALVIAGIAYFVLKADRVASDRAGIYAVAFAIVFLAGAFTHQQFGRHAVAVSEAPRDGATQPVDSRNAQSAQNPEPAGPSSLGALDSADVDQANTLHLRGWALGANGQPATKVTAIVDGITRVDITKSYGRPRPDVAASLKQAGAKNSGYDGAVPLAHLKQGDHEVRISVVASDHATVSSPANSTRTFIEQ